MRSAITLKALAHFETGGIIAAATTQRDRHLQFTRPCNPKAASPELQPAETLWTLVDEPIVNRHVASIEELGDIIARRCIGLAALPDQIRSHIGFHWWPAEVISRISYHQVTKCERALVSSWRTATRSSLTL